VQPLPEPGQQKVAGDHACPGQSQQQHQLQSQEAGTNSISSSCVLQEELASLQLQDAGAAGQHLEPAA
jgi:hypothetical protein